MRLQPYDELRDAEAFAANPPMTPEESAEAERIQKAEYSRWYREPYAPDDRVQFSGPLGRQLAATGAVSPPKDCGPSEGETVVTDTPSTHPVVVEHVSPRKGAYGRRSKSD